MGIHAETGARLRVGSAGATLALPGQDEAGARYDVRLTVDDDAELRWLPEQLISAGGSDLRVTTSVDGALGARLLLCEEQVLDTARSARWSSYGRSSPVHHRRRGSSARGRPSCRSPGPSRW